jgi:hypothetical protein
MKPGKKTRAWERARRKLKTLFEKQEIVRCEKCGADNFLSFAHRFKRRHIVDETELMTVALLCVPCHESFERLPEYQMCQKITEIIANRELNLAVTNLGY